MKQFILFLYLFTVLLLNDIKTTIAADPRCPLPFGLFAHPTDCDRYISCWGGRGFSLSCGSNLVFNPVTQSCQGGFECPGIVVEAPATGEQVRLVNSRQQGTGQVQFLLNNQWSHVTSASFSDVAASLVCQRLGYKGFSTWTSSFSRSGDASSTVNMQCPVGARGINSCKMSLCDVHCQNKNLIVTISCEIDSSSRCPQTSKLWHRWGDTCYLVEPNLSAPRKEAQHLCNQLEGKLVDINEQVEHEFLSSMLKNMNKDSEFYTDGVGVVLAGNGLMWAWQASRFNIRYQRWWPGWNATRKATSPILPIPVPSPSCLILKKSFPLSGSPRTRSSRFTNHDSGFYFFSVADCSTPRPFVCKAQLIDFGCRNGIGSSYSGSANISITGLPCLRWSDPDINSQMGRAAHARASTLSQFDLSLLGNHNFCRNPNGSPSPWCFVSPEVTEECNVPFCAHQGFSSPPTHRETFVENHSSSIRPIEHRSVSRFNQQGFLTNQPVTFNTFVRSNLENRAQPTLLRPLNPSVTESIPKPIIQEKVRCKFSEYQCENSNQCLKENLLCDGTRQCPRGDDERSCKRYISRLEEISKSTLIIRDVVETIYRKDLGICAKKCLDNLHCKGVLYDPQKRECSLSRLSVGESGIITSNRESFYEVKEKRILCSNQHKCNNGRCVSKTLTCDGKNDCGDNSDEAKCAQPISQSIKLTGGIGAHEGNIQVQIKGQWGYICDDDFNWKEADVICKSLGYSKAYKYTRNNAFGQNTGTWLRSSPRFWYSNLNCSGTEASITDCSNRGIGHHDCGPTEIAGVICRRGPESCTENQFECKERRTCIPRTHVCNTVMNCPDSSDEGPELCEDLGVTRLLATKKKAGTSSGTVYVKHKGSWGTVCDDHFEDNHAKVVCRSLGYGPDWAVAYPKAHFGRGNGGVFIDEPGCKGHESHLATCSNHSWSPGNCDHAEDAGVFCSDSAKIRLVGGTSAKEGRVEILLGGTWGTICDDDFDDYDANVVCKMIGFNGGGISHKKSAFGRGSGTIWLENVDCLGTESDLSQCKKSKPGTSTCSHAEDAGVTCYSSDPRSSFDRSLKNRLPGSCGSQSSFSSFLFDNLAKIVGGRTVKRLDSPWLVSLQLRDKGQQKHNCGGVVLSEDLVLTAAHCFRNHRRHSYVVRVGEYDLEAMEPTQEDFSIEKLYIHDDFDTIVEYNNDVALLKIARRNGRGIKLGGSIQPVCLPPSNADYRNARNCKVTGWGTTNEHAEPIPQRLPRSGFVKMFPMSSCIGKTGYSDHEITSGMICAGQMDGSVDTCTGDSGGPLTCEIDGQHVLYGITSWGKGCGRRGQPGMYTKVTKYLRWLNSIVP